jgi:Bacterial SH3 domain
VVRPPVLARGLPGSSRVDERSNLVTRVSQDSTRPTDRLAVASALLGGLVVAAVLAAPIFSSGEARSSTELAGISATKQPARPQAGVQPTPSTSAPASPVRAANLTSSTPAAPTGDRLRVAHTDGQGVVLRASPREDDWTARGFMDSDSVTVLERRGADWARVRGDNGQEGWVPARYLGP